LAHHFREPTRLRYENTAWRRAPDREKCNVDDYSVEHERDFRPRSPEEELVKWDRDLAEQAVRGIDRRSI
jgi:hypothetical protein